MVGPFLRGKKMIQSKIDGMAKAKAKKVLLAKAVEAGLDPELMTENIEAKLDDLLQAVLDDVGYAQLAGIALSKMD